MFTGLVEGRGLVCAVVPDGSGGTNLTIRQPQLLVNAAIGDSIAINGACLTVLRRDGDSCVFQAGPETLAKTNLGELAEGDEVNLERSLRMGDQLGGHLVTGHVDAVGTIQSRQQQGDWEMVWLACAAEIARQIVPKGSVAVDGISLTVVEVAAEGFSVALIPHTLAVTTLGQKRVGDRVNLETDLLGKYVWKYLQTMVK